MIAVANCESGFKQYAYNAEDSHGGAHGIFQYLKPTWNRYTKELGATEFSIYDVEAQIQITAYLWSIGEMRQWSCWKILKDKT